ncbi:hypothetical protein [Aestuariivirga litoralis]|uniref:hypothetical protein n=1 Tax=Aestuariivirga litoralis TaxID=2650924 RepID=UPI0018C6B3E5|nr:hypothetical protein [Aestuariivirga litoralis]MBG1231823.1 hypothetical protein [Aestuariivirga litoralis]
MTQAIGKTWILAGLFLSTAASAAWAEDPPAIRAAEMLARAGAVDGKCHYLKGADRDALSGLVARAELALAQQESVEATKATMQRGRAAGNAAPCTSAEKENVQGVLGAARQSADASDAKATAKAESPAQQKAANTREPIIHQRDASAWNTQQPSQPVNKKKPIIRQTQNDAPRGMGSSDPRLSRYSMMTETYFRSLRCRRGPDLGDLYQDIRVTHDQLMQSHEPGELSFVIRRAKMRAAGRGCL